MVVLLVGGFNGFDGCGFDQRGKCGFMEIGVGSVVVLMVGWV